MAIVARVVNSGTAGFNAAVNAPMDMSVYNTIQANMANLNSIAQDTGNMQYLNTVNNIYNAYSSHEALTRARQYVSESEMALDGYITNLSMEGIANAPVHMQPYIMAHPKLDAMYREGSIEGYPGFYVDRESHIDEYWLKDNYQNATSGLSNDRDDTITYYYNDSEVELTSLEKITISQIWDKVNRALEDDIDPTAQVD